MPAGPLEPHSAADERLQQARWHVLGGGLMCIRLCSRAEQVFNHITRGLLPEQSPRLTCISHRQLTFSNVCAIFKRFLSSECVSSVQYRDTTCTLQPGSCPRVKALELCTGVQTSCGQ